MPAAEDDRGQQPACGRCDEPAHNHEGQQVIEAQHVRTREALAAHPPTNDRNLQAVDQAERDCAGQRVARSEVGDNIGTACGSNLCGIGPAAAEHEGDQHRVR